MALLDFLGKLLLLVSSALASHYGKENKIFIVRTMELLEDMNVSELIRVFLKRLILPLCALRLAGLFVCLLKAFYFSTSLLFFLASGWVALF